MARSTWRTTTAMVIQLTIALVILGLLAFAPPDRGEMLLIPLNGRPISPELLNQLPLVTERAGPLPGSRFVFGSSEGQVWPLLGKGVLILSAPRPLCGHLEART